LRPPCTPQAAPWERETSASYLPGRRKSRKSPSEAPGVDPNDEPKPLRKLDLHGMSPARALARLRSELHTCRVRGDRALVVVTGRGYGNRLQQPLLRTQVEAWLDSPEGRALGADGVWDVVPGDAAPFRTRILVRRPIDPESS